MNKERLFSYLLNVLGSIWMTGEICVTVNINSLDFPTDLVSNKGSI